jgi:hypothetical protein
LFLQDLLLHFSPLLGISRIHKTEATGEESGKRILFYLESSALHGNDEVGMENIWVRTIKLDNPKLQNSTAGTQVSVSEWAE